MLSYKRPKVSVSGTRQCISQLFQNRIFTPFNYVISCLFVLTMMFLELFCTTFDKIPQLAVMILHFGKCSMFCFSCLLLLELLVLHSFLFPFCLILSLHMCSWTLVFSCQWPLTALNSWVGANIPNMMVF